MLRETPYDYLLPPLLLLVGRAEIKERERRLARKAAEPPDTEGGE